MSRIINVTSGKGGAGKTTTAINLGIALTKHFNKKVALVDCNLTTAHVGLYLGMYSTPITLNSVLQGKSSLAGALYIHPSGLRIIPASLNLQDLEGIDDELFAKAIKNLSETFDIILLDSAPGIGREAMMAIKSCNEVLFVANPFIPSVVDVAKVTNLCQTLNRDDLANIKLAGVVLNRIKDKDYELAKEEIEKLTTLPVVGTIPEDEEILQAVNSKAPVILSSPNSSSSKAFIKLAANLIGEKYIEEKPPEIKEKIVKKPKLKPKPELRVEAKEEPESIEKTEPQIASEEKIEEKPIQQIRPLETEEKIEPPIGLTEVEEKEIDEKINSFISEKEIRKPSLWSRVKGFFSKFRR